jgi:hypothetical protein
MKPPELNEPLAKDPENEPLAKVPDAPIEPVTDDPENPTVEPAENTLPEPKLLPADMIDPLATGPPDAAPDMLPEAAPGGPPDAGGIVMTPDGVPITALVNGSVYSSYASGIVTFDCVAPPPLHAATSERRVAPSAQVTPPARNRAFTQDLSFIVFSPST